MEAIGSRSQGKQMDKNKITSKLPMMLGGAHGSNSPLSYSSAKTSCCPNGNTMIRSNRRTSQNKISWMLVTQIGGPA